MKKAVFFDIDGTLWDHNMQVPESTAEGIRRLRENGNYAFICSGRSRTAIRAKELFDMGFDGVLAGCGTHVEYNGTVLFEYLLSFQEIRDILKILKKNKMPVILEGPDALYAEMEDFAGDSYVDYLQKLLGDDLKDISALDENSRINKMSAVCNPGQKEGIVRDLGTRYNLIFHPSPVVEIVPGAFSKAEGIRRICEYLGISHEDTYAFGDSTNDIEMLEYVHTGIAMGNGTEAAKAAADYVTGHIHKDGVFQALVQFGLI